MPRHWSASTHQHACTPQSYIHEYGNPTILNIKYVISHLPKGMSDLKLKFASSKHCHFDQYFGNIWFAVNTCQYNIHVVQILIATTTGTRPIKTSQIEYCKWILVYVIVNIRIWASLGVIHALIAKNIWFFLRVLNVWVWV